MKGIYFFNFFLYFSQAKSILTFFKLITAQFSKDSDLSSYENFQNLFCTLNNMWDKDVIEKGQELKRFYTI